MKKTQKKSAKTERSFFNQDDATHKFMVELDKERTLMARIRGYLLAGILVTAPVGITVYVTWLLINYIDSKFTALIPQHLIPEGILPVGVPGFGLIIGVVFLTLVGWLMASLFGRLFIRLMHAVVARVPVARSIFSVSKQVMETIVSKKSNSFNEVVLVEYPRRDMWGLGFVTGKTEGEVQELTTDEVVNVFIPTTPNPTSGFLLFVPRRDVVPLHMSVEEGIKMVISGGIVTPPDRRPMHMRKANKIPSIYAKKKKAKR